MSERHDPGTELPAGIGPYRVLRLLGEGGMGRVYLAEQRQPQREIALKVVRTAASGEVLQRFQREAELLAGLEHPAIFGKLGLLSPSVWWDDRWIVRQLNANNDHRPDLRIWLDVGTGERRMLKGTRLLYRMLLRKGWRVGDDLCYHEAEGALHDERAWGERTGLFLRFLFPAFSSPQVLARAMSSGMT